MQKKLVSYWTCHWSRKNCAIWNGARYLKKLMVTILNQF